MVRDMTTYDLIKYSLFSLFSGHLIEIFQQREHILSVNVRS